MYAETERGQEKESNVSNLIRYELLGLATIEICTRLAYIPVHVVAYAYLARSRSHDNVISAAEQ